MTVTVHIIRAEINIATKKKVYTEERGRIDLIPGIELDIRRIMKLGRFKIEESSILY